MPQMMRSMGEGGREGGRRKGRCGAHAYTIMCRVGSKRMAFGALSMPARGPMKHAARIGKQAPFLPPQEGTVFTHPPTTTQVIIISDGVVNV